ncbi:MAG: DUF302 domain-containing protein [Candidatus Marinimicrobia bacterium]|jgi:uncharacterized protein (DUF302 family)|nr:DUF302 domain-containing protein [Candidatus Neomarinimicrobiota bacterium]MBT3575691.1 DUF302 domain-containing protein [Candidatus Neomarinimicrobiota bacterium]MBT3679127.1 DUF302 domain-containing protein [Candidatus Neomarinimicrobiota bacterium]MBT3949794.1 DUF302 domain-containing protein [Candidatus Neomarinimicrobiota bacterium]MBT4251979.1 DUF302 domain-containing protein [Candidatus Neomarinimicrobiota bacterium]
MSYYTSTILTDTTFEAALETTTAALAKEGFGIISEIDVSGTLKKKMDVDLKRYTILGACNPGYAHHAIQTEDKIGVFLPCNVVVIEQSPDTVEVAAVDPVASMISVENSELTEMSQEVQKKLKLVIQAL